MQDGLTALMVAADKGYLSIVEALLDGGANVNYKHQVRLTGTRVVVIFPVNKSCVLIWCPIQ